MVSLPKTKLRNPHMGAIVDANMLGLMNDRTKLVLPVIQAKPFFTKNSWKVQEWGVGDPRN